jgi:hypothetical protein
MGFSGITESIKIPALIQSRSEALRQMQVFISVEFDGTDFGGLGVVVTGGGDLNFPVLFEIPRVQPISIGELANLESSGGGTSTQLLGLDPNSVSAGTIRNNVTTLNQTSWDSFYFSTLPGGGLAAANIDTYQPQNTRLKLAQVQNQTLAQTLTYLNSNSGKPEAVALRTRGAFNLNSASTTAWKTVLNNAPSTTFTQIGWNNTLDLFHSSGATLKTHYSRFAQAPGATWSFRHSELGASVAPEGQASLVRNGYRSLAPLDFYNRLTTELTSPATTNPASPVTTDIPLEFARLLTLHMKQRVRSNNLDGGPFLSIGDFANSGLLQTVIDKVSWTNGATSESGLNWVQHKRDVWTNFSAAKGVPSYLSQRDILRALNPTLAARSDTFIIRTYGEVINPADTGQVLGKAWCEAIVQRFSDYVDPTELPERGSATVPGTLNTVNQEFGRRFRVISFRWLNGKDI